MDSRLWRGCGLVMGMFRLTRVCADAHGATSRTTMPALSARRMPTTAGPVSQSFMPAKVSTPCMMMRRYESKISKKQACGA